MGGSLEGTVFVRHASGRCMVEPILLEVSFGEPGAVDYRFVLRGSSEGWAVEVSVDKRLRMRLRPNWFRCGRRPETSWAAVQNLIHLPH